jgi:hypothetical protein
MTLIEILTGQKAYDSSWAIYAQKIDGSFNAASPARFGQTVFENGGLPDCYEFFARNDLAQDSIDEYCGEFELFENLSGSDEVFLKDCWIEDNGDVCAAPGWMELCEWAEEIREEHDEIDLRLEAIHDRWADNCDSSEAALNLIDDVNGSL